MRSLCPFAVEEVERAVRGAQGTQPWPNAPCRSHLVQVILVSLPKPFLRDSALQDLKDATRFCFL